jgi:hypothetical protein
VRHHCHGATAVSRKVDGRSFAAGPLGGFALIYKETRSMKQLFTLGLIGTLLCLAGPLRADDEDKEVLQHIKTLKTSKDKAKRLGAVSDLALIASIDAGKIVPAVPILTEIFKSDADTQLRTAAALVLEDTGAEAKVALPVCLAILRDAKQPADVVVAAVKLVGSIGASGVKETKDVLPIFTKMQEAENNKEKKNETLLEALGTAIGQIQEGTKDK